MHILANVVAALWLAKTARNVWLVTLARPPKDQVFDLGWHLDVFALPSLGLSYVLGAWKAPMAWHVAPLTAVVTFACWLAVVLASLRKQE